MSYTARLFQACGVSIENYIHKINNDIDCKSIELGYNLRIKSNAVQKLCQELSSGVVAFNKLDSIYSSLCTSVCPVFAEKILSTCLGLYTDTQMPDILEEWNDFDGFKEIQIVSNLDKFDDSTINHKAFLTTCCLAHKAMKFRFLDFSASRSRNRFLNVFFPFASSGDKSHTRLDVATFVSRVFNRRDASEINVIKKVLQKLTFGTYNATALGLIIASLSSNEFFMIFTKDLENVCCVGNQELNEYLKGLSNRVRRTMYHPYLGSLDQKQVSQLSYWYMCSSRQLSRSDWDKEVRHRSTRMELNYVCGFDYLSIVRQKIDTVISELGSDLGSLELSVSWEDYVTKRQRNMTSGSTGGVKTKLSSGSITAGKRVFFENVETSEIIQWMSKKPKMVASASEKFELSKARAIYGTQPMDYLIMAYVLTIMEPALSKRLDVDYGLESVLSIKRCYARMLALVDMPWTAMLDYTDFNIQHSLHIQAYVFDSMSDMFERIGIHPDYVKAASWCARAIENSWISYPHLSHLVKTEQGLFSGMRGTSFVNTILNIAYFQAAVHIIKQMFPFWSVDYNSSHQGDDLWVSSNSRAWNAVVYHVMVHAGLKFEPTKQLFSYQKGEFLRVLYSPDSLQGYLGRSTASLIISPLQSNEPISRVNVVKELYSQISVLIRRGLPLWLGRLLWEMLVLFKATKKSVGSHEMVPIAYLSKHSLFKGLNCPKYGDKPTTGFLKALPKVPEISSSLHTESKKCMSSEMFSDFLEVVEGENEASRVVEFLHEQNLSTFRDNASWRRHAKIKSDTYQEWLATKTTEMKAPYSYDINEIWPVSFSALCTRKDIGDVINMAILDFMERIKFKSEIKERQSFVFFKLLKQCLAQTPFANLTEVKTAFNCSALAAVNKLRPVADKLHISAAVMGYLGAFVASTSTSVVNLWLDECEKTPLSQSHLYHPNVLTAIHSIIVARMENFIIHRGISDRNCVIRLILAYESIMFDFIEREPLLLRISGY